jgi:acyl-CoA dehydrogenase
MILTPSEHGWTANGEKYYIGNANVARMVSTFGKIEGSSENGEYVFFAADSQHDRYDLIKNVVNSQNYVANYALKGYPVTEADLLHRGPDAFHAALNTVNVCKYNLGWGAVGMCTHAMYEAVTHAANRHLYGTLVTDFSHVRRLLTDAYLRLVAMRLVCSRASDYMRSASAEDRRYLLYSPLTKAKVTSTPYGMSSPPRAWRRTPFSRPSPARSGCCPGWKAPSTSTSDYWASSCPITCSLPMPRCP